MAIQKVSDLPIFRKNDPSFRFDRVKASLIEMSYKISSDETEGTSRYQSKAVTVGEFADYILSAQGDGGIFVGDITFPNGFKLSGSVYVNENVNDGQARSYQIVSKTGEVDSTALKSYQIASPDVVISCGSSLTVKNSGRNAITVTAGNIAVASRADFTGEVLVPAITEQSSSRAAVNLGYLRQAMPQIKSPFLLFETKYLDYDMPDLSADGWINTAKGAWLSQSSFPNAYNHLRDDWNGGTENSETYPGFSTPIKTRKAGDGHFVCDASQVENINRLAQALGVAWFYVIDAEHGRFMLPRNFNYVKGCASSSDAGKYVQPAFPQHTHSATASVKTLTAGNGGAAQCGHVLTICGNHGSPASLPINVMPAGTGQNLTPASVSMNLYMYCS